jgi:hypothetical protein
MDTGNMLRPHYAEAWTLVDLLAKQPEKLAAMMLALREDKDALAAIQKVYGWDEQRLTVEWHRHVRRRQFVGQVSNLPYAGGRLENLPYGWWQVGKPALRRKQKWRNLPRPNRATIPTSGW